MFLKIIQKSEASYLCRYQKRSIFQQTFSMSKIESAKLRALGTLVPYVLSCPTCSRALRASCPTCSRALGALVTRTIRVLVPYVHRVLCALMPYVLSCLVPNVFSCLTCFTCSGNSRVLHVLVPHVSFTLHFLGMLVTRTLRDLRS